VDKRSAQVAHCNNALATSVKDRVVDQTEH